ncbi:hypothetical protein V8E51_008749 [Hyaloscypha variabilis]
MDYQGYGDENERRRRKRENDRVAQQQHRRRQRERLEVTGALLELREQEINRLKSDVLSEESRRLWDENEMLRKKIYELLHFIKVWSHDLTPFMAPVDHSGQQNGQAQRGGASDRQKSTSPFASTWFPTSIGQSPSERSSSDSRDTISDTRNPEGRRNESNVENKMRGRRPENVMEEQRQNQDMTNPNMDFSSIPGSFPLSSQEWDPSSENTDLETLWQNNDIMSAIWPELCLLNSPMDQRSNTLG